MMMRDSSPEINPPDSTLSIHRKLSNVDWILLAVGLLIFAGGMMFLGPVKLAFAVVFLVLLVTAFFSPKYGLYVIFGAEIAYVLVIYINLMAIAPSMIGLDYTISFVIDDRGLLVVPLVVLFTSYLLGFIAREWLSTKRYVITKFEGMLIAFLLFCVSWTALAIANEHFPLTILNDLHVMMIYTFGIFAARSFKSSVEFRTLFNFMIIFSLFQWIFLIGFFFQQQLYTQFLFFMSLLRFIQGSSDIYAPFIPLMLAMLVVDYPEKRSKLEKHYPLIIFLFSVRTVLSLSRGAMLQVILAVIALYFLLPKENRVNYLAQIKRQLVYVFLFCVLLFIANPNMTRVGFKMILSRTMEGGKSGAGAISQGSLKYRVLETDMVLESISESPIIGFGPGKQTKKRMFTYVSASEEPYVHNGYLWYVLKFGIIGLIFLFILFARYFISLKTQIRGSPPLLKAMLVGTSASLIGILPIAITNNVIAAVQGIIFVSFTFAILIFAERKSGETAEVERES